MSAIEISRSMRLALPLQTHFWYRRLLCFGKVSQQEYMKKSFPKCVKRHPPPLPKWPCNAKFDYYVLEKSFSRMNKCIYMYIFMKSSFLTDHLRTRHCHCNFDVDMDLEQLIKSCAYSIQILITVRIYLKIYTALKDKSE